MKWNGISDMRHVYMSCPERSFENAVSCKMSEFATNPPKRNETVRDEKGRNVEETGDGGIRIFRKGPKKRVYYHRQRQCHLSFG